MRPGGALLAPCVLGALLAVGALGPPPGLALASTNDEVARAFRRLHAAGHEDSARALVAESAARAADVLSAMIRASVLAERAGGPDSAREAAAWDAVAAAFVERCRSDRPDPIVDSVWATAAGWSPAERRKKAQAESLYAAGSVAYSEQRLDTACRDFDAAAALYRTIGDRYRLGYLEMNCGLALAEAGLLPEAAGRLRAATAAFRAIGDRRGEARSLGHSGSVESERGHYAEAESSFTEALRETEGPGEAGAQAEIRNNLGNLHLARGRFRAAGSEYEQAIELYAAVGDTALATAALQNLGIIQEMLGDMRGARRTLETCLAVARATDDAQLASHVASNLANVLFALGEATRADSLHRAALLHDAAVGDAGAVVVDLENLARMLISRGDYSSAADTVSSAIRLCGERGLERERIYLLLTRAEIEREVNELDEAARSLDEAAGAARRLGDRSAEGQALERLGEVQALRGDLDAARTLFADAAAAHSETGEVLRLLETENMRADAELLAGNLAAAAAAAESAEAIAGRAGSVTEDARTMWVAARVAAARGRFEEARRLLDRAAAKLPPHFEQDLAWQIELARADVAERAGDTASALGHLELGIRIVEDVRRGVTGHRERSRYVEDKDVLYRSAVSILLSLGRPGDALALSERARSRAFLDLAAKGADAALTSASLPDIRDLRTARQRIATLVAGWESLEEGGILPTESEAAAALGAEIRDAYAAYEREIRPVLRAVGRDAGAETADLQSIQRALPGGWALVDYFFARDGLVAFVVTRAGIETRHLRMTRREAADLARVAHALVGNAGSDASRVDAVLARLSNALLGTLFSDGLLDGCARLLIVPHAELHLVPFAALPLAGGPVRLIERVEVALLPSASFLVVQRGREGRLGRGRSGPLLALGGVVGGRGPALPFSKEEVTRIGRAASGPSSATLLVGRRAEETAWKRSAAAAGRIHIATHGRLARGSPLFSSLEMAPSAEDDGHLEVHEILRLRLDADVAVLSGCETAQGSGYAADLPPGDEIVGLGRAFLAAGVGTVVATLWPVADRATADFMVELHTNLAGFDPVGALARTQRRWAGAGGRRAHPFYWAGAVAMGSGR